MRPTYSLNIALILLLGSPVIVQAALEADDEKANRIGSADTPPVLEEHENTNAPPKLGPRRTSLPTLPAFGGFLSVQVNVDEFGNNIIGDAANEPSLAVDPTAPNRIVIGWRQFDTINNNFRQAGNAYSHDGGRNWNNNQVLQPGVFRSDPVLDFDNQGNFYYNSLRGDFSCWVFRSTDGGVNWSQPVSAFGGDKQWMAIDRTGGIGNDNIYQAWSIAAGCCGLNLFNRSTDSAASFEEPVPYPLPPLWGTLAIGLAGEVYVVGVQAMPFNVNNFLFVRSSNAQNAGQIPMFDMTTNVDMGGSINFQDAPNPAGLGGQVWVTVDTSDGPNRGNIYMLCSVDTAGPDPADVIFVKSTDGGTTWSAPVRVNDDELFNNAYQWFGTMSIAPNGRLDVIWNDTRNSGQANLSQLYYSTSSDGGVNWSQNIPLSPEFDSWIGWPQQNKIGDYYDMISDDVGAHLAWAATFNGEQDVYYLRIGDYDCNANGVADTDDIFNGDSSDCNENGIPDECEIAAGTLIDDNGNGIPDNCEVPGDLDGDGHVSTVDLLILLGSWGPCADCNVPGDCPADLNGDCTVDTVDLLLLFSNWG
ncbi:MAG: hypothetical protein IH984_07170 [Planctomycetes bacterium]|nr:hypothetical protein [Planctomycetota bacterium]